MGIGGLTHLCPRHWTNQAKYFILFLFLIKHHVLNPIIIIPHMEIYKNKRVYQIS
jgi:hypothetical protein